MWKKTVENKKAEERSRDVAYLRTFVFNFPIPQNFFLFKLIFHSGWAKPRMVSHPNSQGWVFTTSAMTEVQPELSRSSQKANKFLVFTVSSLKPNLT